MQKRNVLNSPRLLELKRKRKNAVRNKIIFFSFLFILLLVGLTFLTRIAGLNISAVEVVGNKVVDTDQVKTVVAGDIAGHYLWLFPKTNILFYPNNKIKTDLAAKFKALKTITLSTKSNGALEISVTERTAIYTWCGVASPDTNKNAQKCYFMDKDGYVFDEAPYFSGQVYFKFYGEVFQKPYAGFADLITFKENLDKIGLNINSMYVGDDGDGKVFLSPNNNISTDGEIYFKTDSDLQKMAENLDTALTTEPLKTNFAKEYSLLTYIDLRFGNKVYYKFKQ